MGLLTALLVSVELAVLAPAAAAAATAPQSSAVKAEDAFAQLGRLVGVWRPADRPSSPLRIRFSLTARGTVLVERWETRGQPHSLTLYHRDGKALLATHYCPQGNQPRLELKGRDNNGLHFAIRDVNDLDPATESHQHNLSFDLTDPAHPVRSETYASKDGVGAIEKLRLVAVKD